MIAFKFEVMFFDRQKVIDQVEKAGKKVLSRFGAFVRTKARSSIRKRKRSAAPGTPPSSHVGLLKQRIFFGWDAATESVVIGPDLLSGSKRSGSLTVPELLEEGGSTRHWRTGEPVTYRQFPFMKPAFDAELPKLEGMFANSVK